MYKLFLLILLYPFSGIASAEVSEVSQYIYKTVQEQVNRICSTCRTEVIIHNEKILADIAKPDQIMADQWKGQTNLLLKLDRDTRIVTVTIRWMDDVVVAAKNIRQGHEIEKDDLAVVEKDVTFMKTAYLQNPKAAIGMSVQRIFSRGQVIDEGLIKKPIVVKYGQSIQLELIQGPLTLTTAGQAKGAGAIGDRIPIYIDRTKTKVQAEIIGKGKARVQ